MTWVRVVGLVILSAGLLGAVYGARRAWWRAAALGALLVLAARTLLVRYGYEHGAGRVRLLDVLTAAAFLCVVIGARHRLGSEEARGEERIALVAGVLALPVASVAIAQLLGPSSPQVTEAAACRGAAVGGSSLQARTGGSGLNARSGPGTTYAPEGRFDVGCVVGVDGYCVGEAVQDVVVPLPDVRWLRLRHSDRYVSAGTLFALGPESALGGAPEKSCPEQQADPDLAAEPKVARLDPDTLLISAKPMRTGLVGFALYYEQSSPEKVEQLGITPKAAEGTGQVFARASLPAIRAATPGSGYVVLAVVPCLAPVVPSHTGEYVLRVDLARGTAVVTGVPKDSARLARLRHAACRVDPSADNKTIAEAAVSKGPSVTERTAGPRAGAASAIAGAPLRYPVGLSSVGKGAYRSGVTRLHGATAPTTYLLSSPYRRADHTATPTVLCARCACRTASRTLYVDFPHGAQTRKGAALPPRQGAPGMGNPVGETQHAVVRRAVAVPTGSTGGSRGWWQGHRGWHTGSWWSRHAVRVVLRRV